MPVFSAGAPSRRLHRTRAGRCARTALGLAAALLLAIAAPHSAHSDILHIESPKRARRLGATYMPKSGGTNFRLAPSNAATKVELCLFPKGFSGPEVRLPLQQSKAKIGDHPIWAGFVPEVGPGMIYGYRVHGPSEAPDGFNPHKLLLDPYAEEVVYPPPKTDIAPLYPPERDNPARFDDRDSGPVAPKGRVIDPSSAKSPRKRPAPPDRPREERVLYELHVGGFTEGMPGVEKKLQGTFAGLASEPSIAYLKTLGITDVELMPVHAGSPFPPELDWKGPRDDWHYNTLGFLAFDPRYCATDNPNKEFQQMVDRLHDAGIGVVLDVVYNHSAEGGHNSATLSFKGLGRNAFLRLPNDNPNYYWHNTGTGNALALEKAPVNRLVRDSIDKLAKMGVDGLRYDLAGALFVRQLRDGSGRKLYEHGAPVVDLDTSFLEQIMAKYPHIWQSGEPYAALGNQYHGRFEEGFTEWGEWFNRLREAWLTQPWIGRLADVLTNPVHDNPRDRDVTDFLTRVTCHDGFTLRDLVSHQGKHNEWNGEDNRDGENNNRSSNHGVEGATTDGAILARRERAGRNLLMSLLVSPGAPLLRSGDEAWKSTAGNNNVWCQAEGNKFPWENLDVHPLLFEFVRTMIHLRRAHPSLRPRKARTGEDIDWVHPNGAEMQGEAWHHERAVGMLFKDRPASHKSDSAASGARDPDRFLLLAYPGEGNTQSFTLPGGSDAKWRIAMDSNSEDSPATRLTNEEILGRSLRDLAAEGKMGSRVYRGGETVELHSESMMLLFRSDAARSGSEG